MKEVKISVCLTAYNAAEHIMRMLDAILLQSETRFEVIAVNNGSTDITGSILKGFATKDERIRVVTIPHGTIADGRQAGMDRARGDYLFFCDADDTMPPEGLSRLLRKAEKTGADVVTGGYYTDTGGRRQMYNWPHIGDAFRRLSVDCQLWNKLFRRRFLVKNGITFEGTAFGEDLLFCSRVTRAAPKIAIELRPVYTYRKYQNVRTPSVMNQWTMERFLAAVKMQDMYQTGFAGTKWQKVADDWVRRGGAQQLKEFLFHFWEPNDREKAFAILQARARRFDWQGQEEVFRGIYGMKMEDFFHVSCRTYMEQCSVIDPNRAVLEGYRQGQQGLRFAVQCAFEWFLFKKSRWLRK